MKRGLAICVSAQYLTSEKFETGWFASICSLTSRSTTCANLCINTVQQNSFNLTHWEFQPGSVCVGLSFLSKFIFRRTVPLRFKLDLNLFITRRMTAAAPCTLATAARVVGFCPQLSHISTSGFRHTTCFLLGISAGTGLDHVRCHRVDVGTGGPGHGERLPGGRPLHVLFLVRLGPRRPGRHHHHGGGVWRVLHPRLVHLRGSHCHLPQPDLVGVVVHWEHRRAAQGVGGRRGNDEAEGPRTEPAGGEPVRAPLQQDQGVFQEEGPHWRRAPYRTRQPCKRQCGGDAPHNVTSPAKDRAASAWRDPAQRSLEKIPQRHPPSLSLSNCSPVFSTHR